VSDVAISVVVPTRDRPEQLVRCVRALAAAARPSGGVEIVVVNDGGCAPRADELRAVSDGIGLRVVERSGGGPAAARNAGAAAASGHILAFTDDDCEPAPGWLPTIERRLEDDPHAIVAGRAVSLHPENDWATASQILTDHLHRWYNRDPERGSFATSNNLALTAVTFRALGGFDAAFPDAAAEDREFVERALRAGTRLIYVPGAVVGHRHRLSARAYLRQHYGYGRGAHRVLRVRRAAGGGMLFESPRFYTALLCAPWTEYSGVRALRLAGFLGASQAAHTAGFVRQALSR
jgi:GT2 family glycosyltransferase